MCVGYALRVTILIRHIMSPLWNVGDSQKHTNKSFKIELTDTPLRSKSTYVEDTFISHIGFRSQMLPITFRKVYTLGNILRMEIDTILRC